MNAIEWPMSACAGALCSLGSFKVELNPPGLMSQSAGIFFIVADVAGFAGLCKLV
jgi:hypothetical protein